MEKSKIFILALMILMPFVSAGGLEVISHETLNLEKNYQADITKELTIINNNEKQLFNIGFEENWVESTPFNLSHGENKTIIIKIKKNDDFSGTITLRGEYEQAIGQSNQTKEVKINYDTGIQPCNIEIIKGDSIKWVNNVLDEITLVETDTQNNFKTILEGENYTRKFSNPEEFTYYAERIIKFTNDCKIIVQDDTGLVHSSEYDFKLPVELKINYEPTTLELTALGLNYTIEYNKDEEDILKLKNTGNKIAKNIKLEADWFEFNKNNFDLAVEESINIGYKISPEVYKTNETDKNYKIKLKISGNFDEINKEFNIYVPYKDLDSLFSSDEADLNFINEMIKYYCEENPNLEACVRLQQVNNSGATTTVQFSEDAIRKLINDMATDSDEEKIFKNNMLEILSEMNQTLNNQSNTDLIQSDEIQRNAEELKNLSDTILAVIIIILSTFAGLIIVYFWNNKGRFDLLRKKLKYQKGELSYQ